jgi:hypothetical protein
MMDRRIDSRSEIDRRLRTMLKRHEEKARAERHWFSRLRHGGTANGNEKSTGELVFAGCGLALGTFCALLPWYALLNHGQFGIHLEGSGSAEQIGASVDPLATGTLSNRVVSRAAPGVDRQPYPGGNQVFHLVHVANGRAILEDDTGAFVVGPGSRLPDDSRVASIEERDGTWVVVTTTERVIPLRP